MRPSLRRTLACFATSIGVFASAETLASSPEPNYFVFFDFGKADLKQYAGYTIKRFLEGFYGRPDCRVKIIGHADTAEASVPLSLARAVAVKVRLVELGVPSDVISVEARGDKSPLVLTSPGTQEPQNRRVENFPC